MAERKRMTLEVSVGENGSAEAQLYLNPAARKQLIEELLKLDRTDDHFHVYDYDAVGDDFQLYQTPYRPGQPVACHFKVMLRYDDWDEEHFPQVMTPPKDPFET